MRKFFFGSFSSLVLIMMGLATSATSFAQADTGAKTGSGTTTTTTTTTTAAAPATAARSAITATTLPIDLARAALAAQGGDKFKSLQSMVLKGSVDLYAPNSTQSVPRSEERRVGK